MIALGVEKKKNKAKWILSELRWELRSRGERLGGREVPEEGRRKENEEEEAWNHGGWAQWGCRKG